MTRQHDRDRHADSGSLLMIASCPYASSQAGVGGVSRPAASAVELGALLNGQQHMVNVALDAGRGL